ncbi:hypothetical protein [Planctobacterium marinum]|uniref:Uncharacterized protein n=1 Tax=Planctobacterium marinum TaxID=1631968 RepID=A0AA48KRD1_9ALTE|nr:hypothetical protein MACH26_29490 [Planctobacterium marinum]
MTTRMFRSLFFGPLCLISGLCLEVQAHLQPEHKADGSHTHNAHVTTPFVLLESSRTGPLLKYSGSDGKLQTLYRIPKGARLFQFDHAHVDTTDKKAEMLLAYGPQGKGEQGIWRFEYVLRTAQTATVRLTPVITDSDPDTWFFDPIYVPGTRNFYYISAKTNSDSKRASQDLAVWFYDAEAKRSKPIAKGASHPTISETGEQLMWLNQHNSAQSLTVLEHNNLKTRHIQFGDELPSLHFPKISHSLQSIFFLSTEKLTLATMPGFSKAFAHPGQQHKTWYAWQATSTSSDIQQARFLWQAENVRDMQLHPDGRQLGYLNEEGLTLYNAETQKGEKVLSGHNFWKFVWIPYN